VIKYVEGNVVFVVISITMSGGPLLISKMSELM
jgi:hypothetical protein